MERLLSGMHNPARHRCSDAAPQLAYVQLIKYNRQVQVIAVQCLYVSARAGWVLAPAPFVHHPAVTRPAAPSLPFLGSPRLFPRQPGIGAAFAPAQACTEIPASCQTTNSCQVFGINKELLRAPRGAARSFQTKGSVRIS